MNELSFFGHDWFPCVQGRVLGVGPDDGRGLSVDAVWSHGRTQCAGVQLRAQRRGSRQFG